MSSPLNETNMLIYSLSERIKNLEDTVNKKTKKASTTRSQQMLILKYCGLIEVIDNITVDGKKMQKQHKAKLLSILLNTSADNVEDDLTYIAQDGHQFRNETDYQFLVKTFEEIGLKEQKQRAEKILEKIIEEKRNKKK